LSFDLMSISHICDVVPERSSIKESLFISRSKDVPWPILICILGLDWVPYLIHELTGINFVSFCKEG
jgi:hypothetical protein